MGGDSDKLTPSVPLASRGKGSEKIAVDVVLIPPESIIKLAIELNRGFPNTIKEDYVLDAKTFIPHISLLMGLVFIDQLGEIKDKLNKITRGFSSMDLVINALILSPNPDGKMFATLSVEKTSELQRLHETILEKLKTFFSWSGVKKEMFYSPPEVREISSFWVEEFYKNSSRENYDPHISIGFTKSKQNFVPVKFNINKLALCHLGNYCTCKDILWSTLLIN